MALKVASTLISLLAGAADIGAVIGLSDAAEKKQKELNEKLTKLQADVESAGDLYDRVYYVVNANMKRLMNAVEQLPDDFLAEIEASIEKVAPGSAARISSLMAIVLGVTGLSVTTISSVVRAGRAIRAKFKDSGKTESGISGDADNPWSGLSKTEATTPKGTTLRSKVGKWLSVGADVASIAFSVGGLALTLGLGLSTISKINDAIEDIEKKQEQVDTFKTGMITVLNEIVKAAGLSPTSNYDELVTLFQGVRKASEVYETYDKFFQWAIEYYYQGKTLDEIRTILKKRGQTTVDPLPAKAYVLAQTVASSIREMFQQGKTDQEIIDYYNDENPTLEQRFVLDAKLVGDLRWD